MKDLNTVGQHHGQYIEKCCGRKKISVLVGVLLCRGPGSEGHTRDLPSPGGSNACPVEMVFKYMLCRACSHLILSVSIVNNII